MTVNELAIEDSSRGANDTPGWRSESQCRKHPTQWWFTGGHRETLQAKSICAECPVQGPCLEFALARPDLLGIWASTTPNERAARRRARRPGAVVAERAVAAYEVTAPDGVETSEAIESPLDPAEVILDTADLVVDLAELVVDAEHRAVAEPDRDVKQRSARRPGRGLGPDAMFVDRNDLLTPAEAARKLGVTPNTVTRWSRAGKIAAIQTMGGHRRFRRSEIEHLLQAATLDTTPLGTGTPI